MFVMSTQHPWQGNEAVQQILVFPCAQVKELFKHEFNSREEECVAQGLNAICASDSNAGAIYKLRAVKNGDGKWIPTIRCGITGHQLSEEGSVEDTAEAALVSCMRVLLISNTVALRNASDNIKNSLYQ